MKQSTKELFSLVSSLSYSHVKRGFIVYVTLLFYLISLIERTTEKKMT